MSREDNMSFTKAGDELDFWKEQASQLRQELDNLRCEFDDFQENSRDLEAELEASLEQTEAKNKDLQAKLQRLEEENEQLKTKLDNQATESYVTISTLQAERDELLTYKDYYNKLTRELEQRNDDLERAKRVTMTSLDDFETKLNLALERNAILENELDEKDQLNVACQRLKDEVRDLRSELEIRTKVHNDNRADDNSPLSRVKIPSSVSVGICTSPVVKSPLVGLVGGDVGTPTHKEMGGIPQPQPITPSARISALNMVGDLLRKVGALETRLASCRTNLSKDGGIKHNRPASPSDSPRMKRIHMQKMNGEMLGAPNLTKITV